MWRQLCARSAPCFRALIQARPPRAITGRCYFFQPFFTPLSESFRNLEKELRDMERHASRAFGFPRFWWGELSPFRGTELPTSLELYRYQNPIIEEEGTKKFLLEFDVRRFKPEDITVKSSEKDNSLIIEAKHSDKDSKYEFCRQFTLPKGVVAKEMKCRFTADGVLQIKAPYTPPPEDEKPKDTEITVQHE